MFIPVGVEGKFATMKDLLCLAGPDLYGITKMEGSFLVKLKGQSQNLDAVLHHEFLDLVLVLRSNVYQIPLPLGDLEPSHKINIKASDLLGVQPEFRTGRTHLCHKWCHQVLVL